MMLIRHLKGHSSIASFFSESGDFYTLPSREWKPVIHSFEKHSQMFDNYMFGPDWTVEGCGLKAYIGVNSHG